jgi:hypothetical protein
MNGSAIAAKARISTRAFELLIKFTADRTAPGDEHVLIGSAALPSGNS